MARTHTFKGSASAGYGYAAFIEEGQLVITEDWGREGGVLYRGPYQHAQIIMSRLRAHAPKLANSIDKYYFEEAKKVSDAPAKEETITHQFKDSRDHYGYGYFGFIENGELVICHEAPREGGVIFRGDYHSAAACAPMVELKKKDKVLYDDIKQYFIKHGVERAAPQPYSTIFRVKLFMDNGKEHICQVRGRFESDVIKKLTPQVPEVLVLQDDLANVFACRSEKISAIEFLDDKLED